MLDRIVPIFVAIYCLTVISVLWKPSRSIKAAYYLNYATVWTLLWTLSILLTVLDVNNGRVVFWSRLSFFFPILILLNLSRFNASFIGKEEKVKIYGNTTRFIINILIVLGIFFAFISFTPLIIANVTNLKSEFGPLQSYYSFFILFSFLLININLTRGYFLSEDKTKVQFGYVLLGVLISSIIGIITNLFIPMITHLEIRYLGPMGVIFFLSFTAYAIIKKKLFDIRVFVTGLYSSILVVSLAINVIFSNALIEVVLKSLILLLAAYSSYRLILSVRQEIANNLNTQKLNFELEKDKEKLVKLDQGKDEFLMLATHELTTPITEIRTKLIMAIQDNMAHLNDEQKQYLMPALDSTNRLNHISQEIVSSALINQNKYELNLQEDNLDALIFEIIDQHKNEAKAKGNKLIYQDMYKAKKILFDRRKIKDVISNLINNAIHFTDQGKICITSEIASEKGFVQISVSDTGSGIDSQFQKNLFNKFSQAGRFDQLNPQEQQGPGLGLYISKKIIDLHHGKIWYESKEGKGSTFYFTLPLQTKFMAD